MLPVQQFMQDMGKQECKLLLLHLDEGGKQVINIRQATAPQIMRYTQSVTQTLTLHGDTGAGPVLHRIVVLTISTHAMDIHQAAILERQSMVGSIITHA